MFLVLTILAILLVVYGAIEMLRGEVIFGIVLIVLGCLVGPTGWSLFTH